MNAIINEHLWENFGRMADPMANSCLPEQAKSPKSAKVGLVGSCTCGNIWISLKEVYEIALPVWMCTHNSITFIFSMG
jgi:hypothetical protein